MMYAGLLVAFLALIRQASAVSKGFHLVQTDANSMWLNYNLDLHTNESSCLNITELVTTGFTPTATISLTTTNVDHATYDISFTFFPHRQVIGGVPEYLHYKNSTKIYEYDPQSYWRIYHPTCTSNTVTLAKLKPFNEICITNTCGRGTCTDGSQPTLNTFKGQLKITGYTTTQQLSATPVVTPCNDLNVGQIEYVAYFDTTTLLNYEVTSTQNQGICQTFAPSYKVGNVPYALEANMTLDNGANTTNFAVQFVYPNGDKKTYSNFGSAFERLGGSVSDNTECVRGYATVSDLTPGWNQVCIFNKCQGSSCKQETYTGTLTIYGQHFDYPVKWVGQIPQTCALLVNAPTYAPSKEPKVTEGKIGAIILVSVFGSLVFIASVYAIVVQFRRLKRRSGINDGSEVTDPGCTWQGWF